MLLPIFKILIVTIIYLLLYKLFTKRSVIKESFNNTPPKISTVIGGQHCPDDSLVFDIEKRADNIQGNECYPKKCPLIKCWYLEQSQKDSPIYFANPNNFTLFYIFLETKINSV